MTDQRQLQWTGALVLFGILFLGVSDVQLIGPLLPSITQELSISTVSAGSLVVSYAISAAVFALLLGTASDRYGRKRLLCYALIGFSGASAVTFQTSHFITLLAARMLTGISAGTLSALALSFAADLYPYESRGKAMGIVSMAYFLPFIVSIPLASVVTRELGWRWVFLGLALGSALMLLISVWLLPSDRSRSNWRGYGEIAKHFLIPERIAGIAAAFLTSGGLSAFLTYVGLWLAGQGVSEDLVFFPYMVAGGLAAVSSLASGWLADRIGKLRVIIVVNLILSPLFLVVSRAEWGVALFFWIAALGIAAGARQGPLHALTTELVPTESRGSYVAVRNAASQLGIAGTVSVSALAIGQAGFPAVGWVAAVATLLVAPVCLFIREPVKP